VSDVQPFRVAFVAGVSPDKWVRRWRERTPGDPLEVSLVDDADQLAVLRDGRADMSFVRLPVDREGLHVIPLYVEVPVVVMPAEHELTLLDELSMTDLADEELIQDPPMPAKDSIAVVAGGAGLIVVPMSVARLHARKDVASRPLVDGPESEVGLAWRAGNEDPRVQTFIGIVRGRTLQSSRGEAPPNTPARKAPAKKTLAKKTPARKTPSMKVRGRGRR
jgi:DNA-binding transcriptional LysR family regulator